jgi:NAD dependent epimerase/dehydratase family enzyme
VTNEEFASTLGDVLGRPSLFPVPGPVISALYGEMATVVLDGQRAVPKHLQELGFSFEYPELKGALADLLA